MSLVFGCRYSICCSEVIQWMLCLALPCLIIVTYLVYQFTMFLFFLFFFSPLTRLFLASLLPLPLFSSIIHQYSSANTLLLLVSLHNIQYFSILHITFTNHAHQTNILKKNKKLRHNEHTKKKQKYKTQTKKRY